MTDRVSTRTGMIAGMTPTLRDGDFVFVSVPDDQFPTLIRDAEAMFREEEGVSLIVSEATATAHGLDADVTMRCITLQVYSSLEGVGLTAAVAQALAEAGIACNMVAASHHDHAFVPAKDADRALEILQSLQQDVARIT